MSWGASSFVKNIHAGPNGEKITPSEKCLLYTLADYYNEDEQCAWPSMDSLAEDSLLSRRQAIRLIQGLEKKNVLNVERDNQSNSVYRFVGYTSASKRPRRGGVNMTPGAGVSDPPVSPPLVPQNDTGGVTPMSPKPQLTSNQPQGSLSDQASDMLFPNPEVQESSVKGRVKSRLRPFDEELRRHTKDEFELKWLPRIWEYYRKRTDRGPGYIGTEKRVKAALARFRDALQIYKEQKAVLQVFAMAIDNLADDPFLSGQNDRQTEYRDWHDHLMKTWETFEKRLRGGKV